MADDSELTLADPAASRKKKWLMLIAPIVVLLGAAGAWFMFGGGGKTAAQAPPAEALAAPPTSHYVPLPRPFVFNVADGQRERLIQIRVQLMVRGGADEALAKQNIPLIEGTLLRVFSTATAGQLMTFEGKEKLHQDALTESRRVLTALVAAPVIEQVLFTGFVMQ